MDCVLKTGLSGGGTGTGSLGTLASEHPGAWAKSACSLGWLPQSMLRERERERTCASLLSALGIRVVDVDSPFSLSLFLSSFLLFSPHLGTLGSTLALRRFFGLAL